MKKFLIFFLAGLTLFSCSKEQAPEDPLKKEKAYTLSIMNDIYYWYKDVPKNINPVRIPTLEQYFDTLLVPQDRWSWMMTGQEYLAMESGQYKIFGASFAQPIDYYNDYSIRVRYVFPNSPMSEHGVKRGYELTHLNGTPVSILIQNGTINTLLAQETNSFTFRDLSGSSFTFEASSRVVNTRSVLSTQVFTPQDFPGLQHNVGYIHYYTFNGNMNADIDNAVFLLKNSAISELILDLRYNGGGDGDALSHLANFVANESCNGQILGKRKHNDRYASYDNNPATMTVINNNYLLSLNMSRIFILTSKATASASEVLINGLKPMMNIVQIGRTTYGKPNGMYVIACPEDDYINPDYILLPIAFYTVNKNGQGNYEDGIAPDNSRPDDLYHDFGVQEDWIKACLTFIATGSYPALPQISAQISNSSPTGVFQLEEQKPGYGKMLFKK